MSLEVSEILHNSKKIKVQTIFLGCSLTCCLNSIPAPSWSSKGALAEIIGEFFTFLYLTVLPNITLKLKSKAEKK